MEHLLQRPALILDLRLLCVGKELRGDARRLGGLSPVKNQGESAVIEGSQSSDPDVNRYSISSNGLISHATWMRVSQVSVCQCVQRFLWLFSIKVKNEDREPRRVSKMKGHDICLIFESMTRSNQCQCFMGCHFWKVDRHSYKQSDPWRGMCIPEAS